MAKQFILDLVNSMSLEEKLGEMTQLAPHFVGIDGIDPVDLTGPLQDLNVAPESLKLIGSTLNGFGAKSLKDLQDKHMKENPHHIPMLFMADVIHGFKTVFPIPLAMGSSFNPDNFEIAAEVAAKESAASGIALTFSPMTDLVRDPRWGRVMESPGEDPYLNSRMTAACVHGFQGDDLKEKGRIASCVKHFAGYGASEAGRDYNTVDLSSGMFREYYLPAYKAAVDAGVAMVMTSFNTIDRIPASASKELFRDILRDEWGFKGVVISDFDAVNETIIHGLSKDGEEAAKYSIEAGVDIEMMSTHYLNYAKKLIDEGKISMDLIDEAVIRILELKDALGLFENPYKDADPEMEKKLHLCAEHRQAARKVAEQCPVLLKNEGNLLPLKDGIKIGVAGPFATSTNMLGGWVFHEGQGMSTLCEALAAAMPASEIKTAMTGELLPRSQGNLDVEDRIDEACEALKDCDVIIATVGENPNDTGEAASKAFLRLTPNQEKMVWALKKLGKPVVLLVFSGRPLEIKPVEESADAIMQAWFLGTEAAPALADILCGNVNPSGRLSMTFPYTVGQIPVYYNCYNTGRPYRPNEYYVSYYLDCPNDPLYCFGHGLSYSTFEYSNFKVNLGDEMIAAVTVKNTSDVAGKETVQLYIRDVAASVVRPLKELKGFQQIELAPGEEKTVSFPITKDMLKFWNHELNYVFEAGEFDIMVGHDSSNLCVERVVIE